MNQQGKQTKIPHTNLQGGSFQEQYEARKRQNDQSQHDQFSSRIPSSPTLSHVLQRPEVDGSSNPSLPSYMVNQQSPVPSTMIGLLNSNNYQQLQQLQQQQQQKLQQQQQQQSGSQGRAQDQGSSVGSSSQPQILTFNQLPPHIQQQVLIQQQQLQGRIHNPSDSLRQNQMLQQQQQVLTHQQQQQRRQQQQVQQLPKLPDLPSVHGLMKKNQLDEISMNQQLANSTYSTSNGSCGSNEPLSNKKRDNQDNCSNNNTTNTTTDNNDCGFRDLFETLNNELSSDGRRSSDPSKRLFLGAQVQPVHRDDNNDYGIFDDDLFKFFDVDMGDDSGQGTCNDFNDAMNKKGNDSNLSFLEPTPMLHGGQPQGEDRGQEQTPLSTVQIMTSDKQSRSTPDRARSSQRSQQQQQNQQQQQVKEQQRQHQHAILQQNYKQQLQVAMQDPTQVDNSSKGNAFGGRISQAVPDVLSGDDQTFMLPSTMVPPTVLASVCIGNKNRSPPDNAVSSQKKAKRSDTPQDVLMRLVERQGHGELKRIKSEDAGYDTMPSPLQLSSFGTKVVHAVNTNDAEMLGRLLDCGLSPNPCNQFRDSILDLVCKRNNVAIFRCLIEHGSDLRVVDGFGRTPLHHCGWASRFSREIVEIILERDPLQLFIEDKRGQTPLEYVRASVATDWSEFLEESANKLWPKGGKIVKLTRPKDSRPDGSLPDPKHAVSANLGSLISSGKISVEQVQRMDEATKKSYR